MQITYDKEVDALAVTLRNGEVAETVEVAPGVLLDLDKQERPLYLEVLDASKRLGKKVVGEVLFKSSVSPVQHIAIV